MQITTELLRQHKACDQGIRYIERFYPNGVEIKDLTKDRHIPKEMLHWGRQNLNYSSEEFEAYCAACDIINTENHWSSLKVHDSNFVVKGENVERSERIFHAKEVTESYDIVYSETITNSTQIFTSSMVSFSSLVAHSVNITESKNVCFSTMVSRSTNIFNSKYVFSSSEIIKSENVTDSYFCNNCKNIKNCMFCDGISDVEYYLFNKPTTKEHFELFVQQYKNYMQGLLNFSSNWPENLIKAYTPSITQKIYEWYKVIPEKFWKWSRTLPNFDSMIIYNITMLPEILVD